MQYRERLPEEETQWIQDRIHKREEQEKDWATYVGMSKSFFSKILHQIKPLPARFEDKWAEMIKILEGDEKL